MIQRSCYSEVGSATKFRHGQLKSCFKNERIWNGKNTICLWYDGDAEEAARFYAKTFPDSLRRRGSPRPGDFPSGKKGDVLTVDFTVLGIPCIGLNGGPAFKHSEAFSFQIATADQAETDRYWNAIVGNGGQESACGWCKDKWGVSWQITPIALTRGDHRPRPGGGQARVRCDDGDEEDRHRHDRGGAARMKGWTCAGPASHHARRESQGGRSRSELLGPLRVRGGLLRQQSENRRSPESGTRLVAGASRRTSASV